MVPAGPGRRPRQPRAGPLRLPGRARRRRVTAPDGLAGQLRRRRLDPGDRARRLPRAVVPPPLRPEPARPRLDQPAGARGLRDDAALLARPRGRRISRRRRPRPRQGPDLPELRQAPRRAHGGDPRGSLLGPGRGPRDLPGMARAARRLRRTGPDHVRRGLGQPRRPARPLRALRRVPPGLQLRLPRDPVAGRSAARGDPPLARGQRLRRCPVDLGAEQPRRAAPREPLRAARRSAPPQRDRRRRPAAGRRARPAPGPCRDDAHARPPRRRLRLPGRGARPARAHEPARRGAPGPDLRPDRRGGARA